MPLQNDESFNTSLRKFANEPFFVTAIVHYKNKDYQDAINQLAQVTTSDQHSHEEKWLAYSMQYTATIALYREAEKQQLLDSMREYRNAITECELKAKYHLIFCPHYTDNVIHIKTLATAPEKSILNSVDAEVLESHSDDDSKPDETPTKNKHRNRKSKSQRKHDAKKVKEISDWLAAGEACSSKGDYAGAVSMYQKIIAARPNQWGIYFACIAMYRYLNSPEDIIRLSLRIIDGLAKDTECAERATYLHFAYIDNAMACVDLHKTGTLIDDSLLNNALLYIELARHYAPAAASTVINYSHAVIIIVKMQDQVANIGRNKLSGLSRQKANEQVKRHALDAYNILKNTVNALPQSLSAEERRDAYTLFIEAAYFAEQDDAVESYVNNEQFGITNYPVALNTMALVYMRRQEYNKALACYQKILSCVPSPLALKNEYKRELICVGICLQYANNNDNALLNFIQAIHCGRDDILGTLAMLGLLHFKDSNVIITDISQQNKSKQNLQGKKLEAMLDDVKKSCLLECGEVLADLDKIIIKSYEPFLVSFAMSMKALVHIKNHRLEDALTSYEEAMSWFPLTPNNQRSYEKAKILQEAKKDPSALSKLSMYRYDEKQFNIDVSIKPVAINNSN